MTCLDFVGFGALNVDKLFRVNRIAQAEDESYIKTRSINCGGSAANTAVGLARLGCKTGFIGKVGGDKEGKMLVEDFCKEGVDTQGIIHAKYGESGTVMGFVDDQGQRALYIHSGVNDSIAIEEIRKNYLTGARFLHFTSFVGEKSFQTQKDLLQILPNTVKVSFDPGVLYAQKGIAKLKPILEKTYLMMPNRFELELITGEKDHKKGADALLDLGVKICAVKLGANGCYITDREQTHNIEPHKGNVVDTTGAGDAFNAGFVYGLLKDKNLLECGKIGNFVASRCVTELGARTSLPDTKALELLR